LCFLGDFDEFCTSENSNEYSKTSLTWTSRDRPEESVLTAVCDIRKLKQAQLLQPNRAAACVSFGNCEMKNVHLISLCPMALCKIMQHLGVNFGGIWKFELGFFICFFLRAMPLFICLNPRSCNASKHLS